MRRAFSEFARFNVQQLQLVAGVLKDLREKLVFVGVPMIGCARNQLMQAPPYPVEQALTRLGENLRTARIRRNFTIDEVAQKIGTGRRAVMDAEKGKPSTGAWGSTSPCCGSTTYFHN